VNNTRKLPAGEHPASVPTTAYHVAPAERLPAQIHATVAEYPRGRTQSPYRVVHDRTIGPASGTFRIFADGREIGRQVSWPTEADCKRLETPAAPLVYAPQTATLPRALAERKRREHLEKMKHSDRGRIKSIASRRKVA
jgi:hypothetical protein